MKPKFAKDKKGTNQRRANNHNAHMTTHHSLNLSLPILLLSLMILRTICKKNSQNGAISQGHDEPIALFSKFVGFLENGNFENSQCIFLLPL